MSAQIYQQVNLYQPIFRRQQHVFSAFAMVKVLCVVAAALMLVYCFGVWQVLGLEAEVVVLEGREKAYAAQLARLDPTDSLRERQRMEDELKALNERLLEQQRLVDVLREQPLGSTDGFSSRLDGLARGHHPGLWLTRMAISGKSGEIELRGVSIRPESIPEYLQQLGEEDALEGQRFETFELDRADDTGNVNFRVSSRSLDEDTANSRLARTSQ